MADQENDDYTVKRVIDLDPGDHCVGPGLFVHTGTVKSVVALDDDEMQILWEGGTHTNRPPDAPIWVR